MKPYYEDEWATLYHGDALTVLPTLAADSVDAVILDPPYSFESISVRGKDDGAAGTSGAPTMLLHRTLEETRRTLRPGGIAPILHQWRRGPDVFYLAALCGLRLTSCVPLRDKSAIPNVIKVEPLSGQEHPYAKPPALWSPFLSRIPKGGVVVDPYAGLGASGVTSPKSKTPSLSRRTASSQYRSSVSMPIQRRCPVASAATA